MGEPQCHLLIGDRGRDGSEPSHSHGVTTHHPPLVVLGQHRADPADDRPAVGEAADHVACSLVEEPGRLPGALLGLLHDAFVRDPHPSALARSKIERIGVHGSRQGLGAHLRHPRSRRRPGRRPRGTVRTGPAHCPARRPTTGGAGADGSSIPPGRPRHVAGGGPGTPIPVETRLAGGDRLVVRLARASPAAATSSVGDRSARPSAGRPRRLPRRGGGPWVRHPHRRHDHRRDRRPPRVRSRHVDARNAPVRHHDATPLPVWSGHRPRHRLRRTGTAGSTPPSPLAITQAHHRPPARQLPDRRAAGDPTAMGLGHGHPDSAGQLPLTAPTGHRGHGNPSPPPDRPAQSVRRDTVRRILP